MRPGLEPSLRRPLEEAMLCGLGERGREGLRPDKVLRDSRVSAADFEAAYGDLQGCLDAGYRHLTHRLGAAVDCAYSTGGDRPARGEAGWARRISTSLDALLAELAREPALALTRGYPSLGPDRQARYQASLEGLVRRVRLARQGAGLDARLPGEVDSPAVGPAEAIVCGEIAAGRTEALPGVGDSILFSLLVPFLGAAGATEETRRPRASAGQHVARSRPV